MSKKPDIITQWAYYAEDSRGFCIEYEVGNFQSVGCIEVSYQTSRPIIDIIKFQKNKSYQQEKLKEIIGCKSIKWAHEEEIRLFSGTIGAKRIPEQNIKKLILGNPIENKKAEWLIDIASRHLPSIEIHKATLCSKEYQVKIEPLL